MLPKLRRSRREIVCQQAVELVTDYLEGTLSRADRRRFEAHLAGCPHCTEYLAQMRATIELTGTVTAEDLPGPVQDEFIDLYRRWRADQGGERAGVAVDPVIGPATPADLERVAGIFAHYVRNTAVTFETTPPAVADWHRRLDDLAGLGLPFLVARTGGEVAGYAYASPWRRKPAYRHTVEDSVYLAPGRTGQGLGRRLLGELLTRCGQAGARQVVAVIADAGAGQRGVGRPAPLVRLRPRGPAHRRGPQARPLDRHRAHAA